MKPISAQLRKKALEAVAKGKSVTQVCREMGICRKSYYQWSRRYRLASPRAKPTSLKPRYKKGSEHYRYRRDSFKNPLHIFSPS